MFIAGLIEKTIKEALNDRINHAYPWQNLHQNDLEVTRGHHNMIEGKAPPGGATWPHLQVGQPRGPIGQPLLMMSVLHRLRDCIYTFLLGRFDPRFQN